MIDAHERVLAQQRFANDRAGYRSMKTFARAHRDRVWAVEGARGVGAGLAQRLVAEGEPVLDVPARLSARVRALGGGSGRKTDDADAFAVAVAGLRARDLQVVRPDDSVEILRLLCTRRQEVVALRIATVNRLHDVLCQLIPGGGNGITDHAVDSGATEPLRAGGCRTCGPGSSSVSAGGSPRTPWSG